MSELSHYPEDCELLFREGLVLREAGDRVGAESRWLRVLESRKGAHFASLHVGLRGYLTRHNLAVLYVEQGRLAEAEAQWRAVLAEHPGYTPALAGLDGLRTRMAVAS